jgi:hypothetical protein
MYNGSGSSGLADGNAMEIIKRSERQGKSKSASVKDELIFSEISVQISYHELGAFTKSSMLTLRAISFQIQF